MDGAPITTDNMEKNVLYYGSANVVYEHRGGKPPFAIFVHLEGNARPWIIALGTPDFQGEQELIQPFMGAKIEGKLTKEIWDKYSNYANKKWMNRKVTELLEALVADPLRV